MRLSIRFSGLVRKGLRFRRGFEAAKEALGDEGFQWYPYDSFASLFYLQRALIETDCRLEALVGDKPILDIGAGDGALAFFFESLGFPIHAIDCSKTNMNRMRGIYSLARHMKSNAAISDLDLDAPLTFGGTYGLALMLGTLYHLKNPYHVLETLGRHARFCFLSTRVARLSADRTTRLDRMPVAYLLGESECNSDSTNYWVFSCPGLKLLLERTGWAVRHIANSGSVASDPVSPQHDERVFVLMSSLRLTDSEG